jgi:nucleoside-diphosphate-sugar epimerase
MMKHSQFDGKHVLVVGGAGFVGSNLSHMLLHSDIASLTIVDNFMSSESINVPTDERVRFIEGSIADDAVLEQLPAALDYVWHLACYHGNQSSIFDPIADHANNNFTSLKLFEHLSKRNNLTKVVYSAAGCAVAEKTYGEPTATHEDAPVSLFHDSPYSISKLVGEMYGNYYFKMYGMPFVKARFQNVYGPREILGAGKWRGTYATVWRNVTPTFVWKSLHGEALGLDNGGMVSRDFIFVDDICRGLIACGLHGAPGEAYNIASGVETTIKELAETINSLTGNTTPMNVQPARDWDNSGRRFGSTEKSQREIGFVAEVSIEEGLRRTVEWTRQNHDVIARTMSRHDANMAALENS